MVNRLVGKFKGIVGAYIAYPVAEKIEKREISSKVQELKKYYSIPYEQRREISLSRLVETLSFAGRSVPYYQELFKKLSFDPNILYKDIKYLNEIPYLTKDIINEQGDRLLAAPLNLVRHHLRQTGGSTGVSADIYYDQVGLDYSAAIVRFARDSIGHKNWNSEVHFAASFAKPIEKKVFTRENIKNFSLNRSNVFFDKLDGSGIEKIVEELKFKRAHLVHSHPSTMYEIACFVEDRFGSMDLFDIFESSGELLQPYMKEKIDKVFSPLIIDRYGLAEFGVIGYQTVRDEDRIYLLDSEGWAENKYTDDNQELVFTGFHNRLMPLIRYATGDFAKVAETENGLVIEKLQGRIHDIVLINNLPYPTHHIMDVLDHKVGGVQQFQIDISNKERPIIRVVSKKDADIENIKKCIKEYWNHGVDVEIIEMHELIKVGRNAKFRHLIS